MKENVLDILIYLFENYMLDAPEDQEPDEDQMMQELAQAGFSHLTIDKAFDWLETLAVMCEQHQLFTDTSTSSALRIYTAEEQIRITVEAQGLLFDLERTGILNITTREMVIDRLMALESDDIELDNVKWVILMVLTNCNQGEGNRFPPEWVEALIYNGLENNTH